MKQNIEEWERFTRNVKTLRKNNNLTQLGLGEKIGLKKTTICMIEAGNGTSFETLFRLADFFNVTVSELFSKDFERVVICKSLENEKTAGRKKYGRYSGRKYENSPERLDAIREKYSQGITAEIMKEFELKLGGGE